MAPLFIELENWGVQPEFSTPTISSDPNSVYGPSPFAVGPISRPSLTTSSVTELQIKCFAFSHAVKGVLK